jgi:hypothetical protein
MLPPSRFVARCFPPLLLPRRIRKNTVRVQKLPPSSTFRIARYKEGDLTDQRIQPCALVSPRDRIRRNRFRKTRFAKTFRDAFRAIEGKADLLGFGRPTLHCKGSHQHSLERQAGPPRRVKIQNATRLFSYMPSRSIRVSLRNDSCSRFTAQAAPVNPRRHIVPARSERKPGVSTALTGAVGRFPL